MSDQIFTTKGFLPREAVRFAVSIHEDENCKVTRTDKYLASTDEWVGNDLHVEMKKGLGNLLEQGAFH